MDKEGKLRLGDLGGFKGQLSFWDTGANVNTITPKYATALGFHIGPLTDLRKNGKIAIKVPWKHGSRTHQLCDNEGIG